MAKGEPVSLFDQKMSEGSPLPEEKMEGSAKERFLLDAYGTTDPFEIAARRRAQVRGNRQGRIDNLQQVGWVEIDGDARVPDDDISGDLVGASEDGHDPQDDLTEEQRRSAILAEQAMDEFDAIEPPVDKVIATTAGPFQVEIPEQLLVVHFVVSYPDWSAEEAGEQRRLLLRKFQQAAQDLGYTPVLATAKEAKASDLANSGSELQSAARALGVRRP